MLFSKPVRHLSTLHSELQRAIHTGAWIGDVKGKGKKDKRDVLLKNRTASREAISWKNSFSNHVG